MPNTLQAIACFVVVAISITITMTLGGCSNDPDFIMIDDQSTQSRSRCITEREATLINTARAALAAHDWPLQDRVYSVRRDRTSHTGPEGDGWIVQADWSPGIDELAAGGAEGESEREPGVMPLCSSFFIDIDAQGRPTRLSSHMKEIELLPGE